MATGGRLADLVTDLAIKLEKAIDPAKGHDGNGAQDASQVLDILQSLNQVEMNVDVLKISKVGFAVKKVKANKDLGEAVLEAASQLLKKWKKACVAAPSPSTTATISPPTSAPHPPSAASCSSSSSSAAAAAAVASITTTTTTSTSTNGGRAMSKHVEKTTTTISIKAEKGGSQQAAASLPTVITGPPNVAHHCAKEAEALPPQRLKIANLMFNVFSKCQEGQDGLERAAQVALGIEAAMNEATDYKGMTKQYGDKARSLKYNLDSNEHLRYRVIVSDIDPVTLVNMKAEDMQPEEHRKKAEEVAKLAYEANLLDWHDKNVDKIRAKLGIEDVGGSFTCGRCKQNKTSYQAKQTRSSDEPMTMFIRCLTCGNRWKEN